MAINGIRQNRSRLDAPGLNQIRINRERNRIRWNFPKSGLSCRGINAAQKGAQRKIDQGSNRANAAKGNVYIKSLKINGQEWNSPFITHSILSKGGLWEFDLTDSPLY